MRKHNRHTNGFTIVELAVVIGIMGILATVGVLSYIQVQKQTRDTTRQHDMVALQSQLEKFYDKNGVYPPGCPQASCSSSFISSNTSAPTINSDITLATLKTIFPSLSDKFGDPSAIATSTPIIDRNIADSRYYYFGGAINTGATSDSKSYPSTATMPCSARTDLAPNETSSYLIGYFSEVDQKWNFIQGSRGVGFTVAGNTAKGCVINP